MALHLLGTVYHLGETAVHAFSGNGPKAFAGAVKTVASIIPGGGMLAHVVIGKVVDTAIVDGQGPLAGQIARNAWNGREDISDIDDAIDDTVDKIQSSIDAMGDGDGIAEISDIFSNWF